MRRTILFITPLLLFHCGGRHRFIPKLDPEDRFIVAKRYMADGKYVKAQEEFKRLMFENPGSDYVDDAQYYLAEAYFLNKEYDFAILEYAFLIDNYRGSQYVEEARLKLARCYYGLSKPFYLDQTETQKALDEIELFLAIYPESEHADDALAVKKRCLEKLARKDLEAGKLYTRLRKHKAARIYFESVAADYPDTEAAAQALLLMGMSYETDGDTTHARETYNRLLATSKDDAIISQAKARLEKLGSD